MEDLIRHQQENRFAHPPIVTTDIANWPHITRKDAGVLTDSQIWLEAMQSKACQVQYKAVIFGDSERMRIDNQHCVSLSADGKLLAAATRNTITIWRLQDGLTVQRLERDGHTKDIWQISFSPDSRHIVSGAEDKVALLWNVKTGNIMRRLMGHEYSVVYTAFSPDGIRIATRSSDSLKIWDASSGNLLHTNTDLGHSGPSTEIRFSPDGSRLMARTSGASREDTAVAVLDCRTGERIATLRKRDILCMAFSPSGDRIATGSEDGSVCVWDAASGKALLVLKEHTYHVWDAAFSPDGGEVATASSDGTVVTCDVRTGKRRFTFRVESVQGKDKKTAWAVAYSPRNKFIACGADDGCVHVWNRTTAAFVAAFQGHRGNARHVIFTMDGWNVMSYGPDRVVRMWSICDALRLS
ncbi:WD40 repeat domain-containing protein [Phanerochaete sordida]|uniref:WD40 repeat domain-containing protein n=1 Tax=Phanerochaete sordida TaxID=48140 RepID=A0A9P3GK77_9APHY|nr:WD40 repeat domain-containing protein [Phanerochaete sordida]